jgi:elongation factor Tu
VATGKVEAGAVRVGDELSLDGGRTVKVDGVEAFRKKLDEATEGMNIGLLFKDLDRADLAPGMVLSAGGTPMADPPGFHDGLPS